MTRFAAWCVLATALTMIAGGATRAMAQQVRTGDLVLDLTGRIQAQFNTTSVNAGLIGPGDGEPPASVFETRRIRLGTEIAYGEWITGKVEADFAGSAATLKDGWVNVALSDGFQVQAGQFKKPFSLLEHTSSTKMPSIERGLRIRGLDDAVRAAGGVMAGEQYRLLDDAGYAGRDIGVMGHGTVGRLGYAAGIFSGEGDNRREELGTKAYAARATYAALPALRVGASAVHRPSGVQGPDGEVTGTAWGVESEWGEFRGGGLWLVAEVTGGDNLALASAATPDATPDMLGAQAMGAWFLPRSGRVDGLEPTMRLSWGDPDTNVESDEGLVATPGFNLYFGGRNRLMLNVDAYLPGQAALERQYALRAQMQVHF